MSLGLSNLRNGDPDAQDPRTIKLGQSKGETK